MTILLRGLVYDGKPMYRWIIAGSPVSIEDGSGVGLCRAVQRILDGDSRLRQSELRELKDFFANGERRAIRDSQVGGMP